MRRLASLDGRRPCRSRRWPWCSPWPRGAPSWRRRPCAAPLRGRGARRRGRRVAGEPLGAGRGALLSAQAATVLARRLDLLPAPTLGLLTAGAVLGRTFDLGLAARLAGQSPEGAAEAVAEARRRHLLWSEAAPGNASSTTALRETLLSRLDPPARRDLHRRAARPPSPGVAPSPRRRSPTTWTPAGSPEEALPYAIAAAADARGRHALAVAEAQYLIAERAAARRRRPCAGSWPRGWGTCWCSEGATRTAPDSCSGPGAGRRQPQPGPPGGQAGRAGLQPGRPGIGDPVPGSRPCLPDRPGHPPVARGVRQPAPPETVRQALHSLAPRLFTGQRAAGRRGRARRTPVPGADAGLLPPRGQRLSTLGPPALAEPGGELPAGGGAGAGLRRPRPPTATCASTPPLPVYAEPSLALRQASATSGAGASLCSYGLTLYFSGRWTRASAAARGRADPGAHRRPARARPCARASTSPSASTSSAISPRRRGRRLLYHSAKEIGDRHGTARGSTSGPRRPPGASRATCSKPSSGAEHRLPGDPRPDGRRGLPAARRRRRARRRRPAGRDGAGRGRRAWCRPTTSPPSLSRCRSGPPPGRPSGGAVRPRRQEDAPAGGGVRPARGSRPRPGATATTCPSPCASADCWRP